MLLRVRSITYLAEAINGYELVDPRGRDLTRFTAGAHIAVRHGDSAVRDYSLWNDPAERRHYCIAVLRERQGQGSGHWHERVRVGDPVEAAMPRNNFPLIDEAERDRPRRPRSATTSVCSRRKDGCAATMMAATPRGGSTSPRCCATRCREHIFTIAVRPG